MGGDHSCKIHIESHINIYICIIPLLYTVGGWFLHASAVPTVRTYSYMICLFWDSESQNPGK